MTKEEAIKILKVGKAEIEWEYPLDYQPALDKAIESLKLQIPQEPEEYTNLNTNEEHWICPNCSNTIYVDSECGPQFFDYCNNCGQHLKWDFYFKETEEK